MGSLVHSRDKGKAAAVSVPYFQSDLVSDVSKREKIWLQAFEFDFLVLESSSFLAAVEK